MTKEIETTKSEAWFTKRIEDLFGTFSFLSSQRDQKGHNVIEFFFGKSFSIRGHRGLAPIFSDLGYIGLIERINFAIGVTNLNREGVLVNAHAGYFSPVAGLDPDRNKVLGQAHIRTEGGESLRDIRRRVD